MLRTIYPPNQIYLLHATHDHNGIETRHAKGVAAQFDTEIHIFDPKRLKNVYESTLHTMLTSRVSDVGIAPILRTSDMSNIIYSLSRSVAREVSGTLVGTIDLTEILTGYYAKDCFCGDFLPMGGLLRGELRKLARLVGVKSFLPERWHPMPGCGNIASDISTNIARMGGSMVFRNEDDLEAELVNCLGHLSKAHNDLDNYIRTQLHKIRTGLLGRPVFFGDQQREKNILSFIQTETI